MAGIFVSYRRGQSAGYAGRLADTLSNRFGKENVFRDIEDISAGADFVDRINQAVGACEVLLVVISPGWVAAADPQGRRRLDNPQDFVRLEIETALKRNVRVVPLLVGGAAMPSLDELPETLKLLSRRQAHELSDSRWDFDMDRLMAILEKSGLRTPPGAKRDMRAAAGGMPPIHRDAQKPPQGVNWLAIGGIVGVAVIAVIAFVVAFASDDGGPFGDTQNLVSDYESQPAEPPVEAAQAAERMEEARQPSRPAPSADDRLARERPRIILALEEHAEAEIEALIDLDPEPLYQRFTGQALQAELNAIQQLQENGLYQNAELLSQNIQDISLSQDGRRAEVRVVERWSTRFHSELTDECIAQVPAHDVPQTIYLVLQNDRWMVDNLVHDGPAPDPVACY